MAAISTKGSVFVEGAQHPHMITFLNKLREVNAGFEVKKDGIEFFYKGPLKGGIHIETDVHPGFYDRLAAAVCRIADTTDGASVVHETVYENRFGYTETLKLMGADIEAIHSVPGRQRMPFCLAEFSA